jgi:hypothetical protein
MKKQVELSTGIKTTQNKKKSGKIEILVQNNDYDNMYDQLTIDTELSNNTELFLTNLLK